MEGHDDGWQLAGSGADAYECYLVPLFMTRWADQLVALAAPAAGDRVLDACCGTGIVARTVSPRVGARGRVTGLDLNEDMLRVARATGSGVSPAIDWRQGNVAELPFADAAFDVVFCQQAMQFLADPAASLRELRRVLGPKGRLGLSVCRPIEFSPGYAAMANSFQRHVGAEAAAMVRSIFVPWSGPELRALVSGAGFQDVRIRIEVWGVRYPSVEEFVRQEAASSPLAGPIAALRAEARSALVRDLAGALEAHLDDDGVSFPIETFVVLAHH